MTETPHHYQLFADELAENDRSEFLDFSCGDESWSKAATEWIVGSDVWESIEKRKTKVWLYRTAADLLVGFGSLGMSRRRWPPPDGGFANLLIIPMLGLDFRFHGKPPDKEWRYSNQIVSHLRYEAIQLCRELTAKSKNRSTLPLLSLFVHEDNEKAIRLYEKFGFAMEPKAKRGDHMLMIQKIVDEQESKTG